MEDRNYTGDDTRELGPEHDICPNCGSCRCEDCLDCTCDDPEPRFSYEPSDEPVEVER